MASIARCTNPTRCSQLNTLLAPLQGRLPNTEQEVAQMQAYLRRMGHLIEGVHGGLGHHLRKQTPAHADYWARAPASHAFPLQPAAPTPMSDCAVAADSSSMPSSHPVDFPHAFGSGTDTDTSSDDTGFVEALADLSGMTDAQAAEHILWRYRHAKGSWRH